MPLQVILLWLSSSIIDCFLDWLTTFLPILTDRQLGEMEEARALLESAERGKRQVGAGQIVLFDISGHDHLGGGGARRVQGGRQPDEHNQLKGENQCLQARDIKNISQSKYYQVRKSKI